MRLSFVSLLFVLTACSGEVASPPSADTDHSDSGLSSDAGDAAAYPCGSSDDAGFASLTLATLAVTELCEQAAAAGSQNVAQVQCGSLIWVTQGRGGYCLSFWVFDATTGALEAFGGGCNGVSCYGAAPGFEVPSTCNPAHCTCTVTAQPLCTGFDAGEDAALGAGDGGG
jgi:hypothetical protein